MFSMILNRQVAATASLSAIAALAGGLLAPSAQAINLVPQQEGEVKTNLGCLTTDCDELDSNIFDEVISHEVNSDQQRSYLFVDKKGSEDKYYNTLTGKYFTFGSEDLGTTEQDDHYWFRPVLANYDGSLPEHGQLEVGIFEFKFKQVLSKLNLSFFDTEDTGTSFEVYYADHSSHLETIAPGSDKNIQDFTLYNVKGIKLNLGNADSSKFHTGDGVTFKGTASVPEPSMMLGAIAAVVGGGMLRQRRQANADA